jgi:GxGYxYP putative glycoside hydrolase C-terminal domain/GxGYxY sequence motif in domain of unknown function N-terminal
MSFDVPGLDWSSKRIIPGFQPVQHLDVYDFRGSAHDVQLAAATCAGVINRPQPRVYQEFTDDDEYWLQQIVVGQGQGHVSTVPQTRVPSSGDDALVALLDSYQADIKGLIIYDPACMDSINVATTLAGLRSGIVVSPSLAQNLQERYQLPLILDLRTFHWRSRIEAYLWAQQQLLPECSSRLVAGMNPVINYGLRSFLVATRTFVYWLDSRNYFPDGHAGMLSERGLMRQILQTYVPNALHLGWVIDEFSGIALLSRFAIAMLASDHFNNLEVWTAIKPSTTEQDVGERPVVEAQPSLEIVSSSRDRDALTSKSAIYVSFALSDGDNIQYCQHQLPQLWNNAVRGTIPLGWTLSPLLLQAAPAMGAYYRETATVNDELIAGPSGAGYMYPTHWPRAHLPKFLQQTGELMSDMGMTTLEVLDADCLFGSGLPFIPKVSVSGMTLQNRWLLQQFARGLAPYGMRGMISGNGFLFRNGRWEYINNVPVCHNLGLVESTKTALLLVRMATKIYSQRPLFLSVYVNAWFMGPAQIQQVMQELGEEYTFVLPRRLLAMLAETY